MTPFTYTGAAVRVRFGADMLGCVGEEIAKARATRALVLSTPQQAEMAHSLAGRLGGQAAGIFTGAAMHTPVTVTEAALDAMAATGADCTVAVGGGSTIGLGKAISWRRGTPQIAVPTTYAGSEATPILGQTEGGRKTTVSDPAIRPQSVIYDVDLTLGLPTDISATSGMNAIAHAVEGLYARDRNPIVSLMAREGIAALARALPMIVADPADSDARGDALYGAWLCGTVLGSVGMALHHKLCHTLGGSFDLPHAETHAVLLPYATAFNAVAAPDLLEPVAAILGADSPGGGLQDLARRLGAPTSLRDLGLPGDAVRDAAEIAMQNTYWNPRAFNRDDIERLLAAAWRGDIPETAA